MQNESTSLKAPRPLPRMGAYWKTVCYFLVQGLATALIVFVGADLYAGRFGYHFPLVGDANHHLMIAQNMIDGGWIFTAERLGAPFSAHLSAFPVGGTVDQVLLKLICFGVHDAPAAVELWWLLLIAITGVTCTWSLRQLGLPSTIAFICGIAYATLPHIYYRNIAHIMLSYYLVPLVGLACVKVATGQFSNQRAYVRILLFIACVLMGFNYIYTAFFSCIFLSFAALMNVIRSWRLNGLLPSAILISAVALASAINLIPTARTWAHEPEVRRTLTGFKQISEADMFGLKIRHLLMPIEGGLIDNLFQSSTRERNAAFPLENENTFGKLGTTCALGLILLLVVGVSGSSMGATEKHNLTICAGLAIVGILVGTVGGLGSIFNLYVSADIRCYNRIAVFIAFFSVFATGYSISMLVEKTSKGVAWICCTAWLIFIIIDQRPPVGFLANEPMQTASLEGQKTFIDAIEHSLPAGAMIVQLPFTPYPVTPDYFRMHAHDHLRCYWMSKNLRWSYPELSSEGLMWAAEADRLGTKGQLRLFRSSGISGVWVDTYGYADSGNAKLSSFRDCLKGVSQEYSPDGRYVFFNISHVNPSQIPKGEEMVISFGVAGNDSSFLGIGWSNAEPGFRWTLGHRTVVQFDYPPVTAGLRLRMKVFPLVGSGRTTQHVEVRLNGRSVGATEFKEEGEAAFDIPTDEGGQTSRIVVEFDLPDACTPESLGINGDKRELGLGFRELSVESRAP